MKRYFVAALFAIVLGVIVVGSCQTCGVPGPSCSHFYISNLRDSASQFPDGRKVEGIHDIYATFSTPATEVHLEVTEPSGEVYTSYDYRESFYTPGQTSFALGMMRSPKSNTTYVYTVTGREITGSCKTTRSGSFTSGNF